MPSKGKLGYSRPVSFDEIVNNSRFDIEVDNQTFSDIIHAHYQARIREAIERAKPPFRPMRDMGSTLANRAVDEYEANLYHELGLGEAL